MGQLNPESTTLSIKQSKIVVIIIIYYICVVRGKSILNINVVYDVVVLILHQANNG